MVTHVACCLLSVGPCGLCNTPLNRPCDRDCPNPRSCHRHQQGDQPMTDAMKQLERVPLVVAHPVPAEGGVLSTQVPLPTDGLPEWGRCQACGVRAKATLHHHPEVDSFEPMSFDGPFPFTVAVWQECPACLGDGRVEPFGCPSCEGCGGAVVATVEVTGPSHHADECGYGPLDAPPDRWHTPTGTVTRLDVPIPMERPSLTPTAFGPTVIRSTRPLTERSEPAPWWWADLNLEVPA